MTTRYHFEDFCWFPCASVKNAIETLKWRTDAIHINHGIQSNKELQLLLDQCLQSNCVEGLFLPCNNIGDEGMEMIAEFLRKDRYLSYLYLERNSISSDSLELLVDALSENKRLKTLMLGDNAIDDKGVAIFCTFLRSPECTIKEFSIGNMFGDVGALLIAKALNFNKDIEAIYLNNNEMTDIGAGVLAEVVSRHSTCSNVQVSSRVVNSSAFEGKLGSMTQQELKKAFEMAVYNNDKGPWMRSKIMVVGQGRAGKTASVRSLLGQKYVPGLDSTIGASISQSNTKAGADGAAWGDATGDKVDFTVDTAARLAALKLAKQRNEDKEKLEQFDINETIEYYKNRKDELQNLQKKETKQKINQVMSEEEINQRFDTQLVTNKHSGKDDIAFTIWDYGGQTVFYTLHHLFLTRYGIYLLVFDMRELVCQEMNAVEKAEKRALTRDYLLFWLNSVTMHAPEAPLMIIGTFMDFLESNEEFQLVNQILDRILSVKHKRQIHMNGALYFYPLNNRRPETDYTTRFTELGANIGRNIEVVRDQIEVIARSQEFVNQELSLRWVKTLDTMLEQPENFLDIEQVYKLATGVGIDDRIEVDRMLAFFHELGMIVHLTSTENLRKVVTTKPQWLIDGLSQIIRDEKLHKFNMALVEKQGLREQHDLLMEKHVCTIDWMEYVWKKQKVGFLIDLMRRTLLISDWKFGDFENDMAFLVPSLINEFNNEHADIAEVRLLQFESPHEDQLLTPDELNAVRNDKAGALQRFQRAKKKKIPGFGRINIKKVLPDFLGGEQNKEGPKYEEEREDLLMNTDVNKFYLGPPSAEFTLTDNSEENERRFYALGRKTGEAKPFYGFAAPEGVSGVIFDFTQSFLPNGVFQRLLCLCILKSTNSRKKGEKSKIPEPQLFSNSAIIWIAEHQLLTLIKHNSQILCLIDREHYNSYKMLSSMMEKLRADVMGHSLKWDVLLEVELDEDFYRMRMPRAWRVDPDEMVVQEGDNRKPQRLSLHTFRPVTFVKKNAIAPWYADGKEVEDKEIKDLAGLELEEFIEDLDQFF